MTITAEVIQRAKDQVETLRSERAKEEARLEQFMQRLKKEFGVDTVESAERKLTDLQKEKGAIEGELEEIVAQLEEAMEEISG